MHYTSISDFPLSSNWQNWREDNLAGVLSLVLSGLYSLLWFCHFAASCDIHAHMKVQHSSVALSLQAANMVPSGRSWSQVSVAVRALCLVLVVEVVSGLAAGGWRMLLSKWEVNAGGGISFDCWEIHLVLRGRKNTNIWNYGSVSWQEIDYLNLGE